MKTCPNCGTSNDDQTNFCTCCGRALPESGPFDTDYGYDPENYSGNPYASDWGDPNYSGGAPNRASRPKKSRKGIKTVCIVLGALLAAGIVTAALLFTFSPKLAILRAAKTTIGLLPKTIESNFDLPISSSDTLEAVAQGEYSGNVEFEGSTFKLSANFDCEASENLLSGSGVLQLTNYSGSLSVNYSAEGTLVKVLFPDISADVYGLDLEEAFGDSAASRFPAYVKEAGTLFTSLGGLESEEYAALFRVAEAKNLGKSTVSTDTGEQTCTVYELRWGEGSDTKLIKILNRSGGASAKVKAVARELSRENMRLLCFVKGDKMLCFDLTGDAGEYMLLLRGANNPWDSFDISMNDDETGTEAALSAETVRAGSTVQLKLTSGGSTVTLYYDTENGDYALYEGVNTKNILQGNLQLDEEKLRIAVYAFNGKETDLQLTFTEQAAAPQPVSDTCIDILDWKNLLLQAFISSLL